MHRELPGKGAGEERETRGERRGLGARNERRREKVPTKREK